MRVRTQLARIRPRSHSVSFHRAPVRDSAIQRACQQITDILLAVVGRMIADGKFKN